MQEVSTAPQCTKKNAADPGFPRRTFVLEDVQLVARAVHKDAAGEAMPGHSCSLLLMTRQTCTKRLTNWMTVHGLVSHVRNV